MKLSESALIVLSILLAFAIDAWWDGRQDEIREARMIEALKLESEENRTELNKTLEDHVFNRTGTDTFFRASPQEMGQVSVDSTGRYISALVVMWTYDPETSAAEVFLSSSQQLSLKGQRIRLLASRLLRQLRDAEEERQAYFNYALESTEILARTSTSSFRQGASYIPAMALRLGPPLLEELRSDEDFVASVGMKLYQEMIYNLELRDVSSTLDSLRAAFIEE